MEIARKTDYALRMLATLATDPAGVVSVREVARANGGPYSLRRAALGPVPRWQVGAAGCGPRVTGGFELLRPQEGGAVPGAAGAPDEKDSHA